MSAHDSDGAMGVVLNRPLGRRLGELDGDFSLGPLASVLEIDRKQARKVIRWRILFAANLLGSFFWTHPKPSVPLGS